MVNSHSILVERTEESKTLICMFSCWMTVSCSFRSRMRSIYSSSTLCPGAFLATEMMSRRSWVPWSSSAPWLSDLWRPTRRHFIWWTPLKWELNSMNYRWVELCFEYCFHLFMFRLPITTKWQLGWIILRKQQPRTREKIIGKKTLFVYNMLYIPSS